MVFSAAVGHPVDTLIDNVISGKQKGVSASERAQIVDRMATVPFCPEERELQKWARLFLNTFLGKPHPNKPSEVLSATTILTSLEYHTLKHTFDESYANGTSCSEYLAGARAGIRNHDALDLGREELPGKYQRSRGATRTDVQKLVGTRVRTSVGKQLFVLYDPPRHCILSAYSLVPTEAERALAKWKVRYKL